MGTADNKTYIHESNWSPAITLEDASESVSSVAFSGDSKLLAAGCDDSKTYIYDATGRPPSLLWILKDASYFVNSVAFSGDSKLLAVGSEDYKTYIYARPPPLLQLTLRSNLKMRCLHLSGLDPAGGKFTLKDCDSPELALWIFQTGQLIFIENPSDPYVYCVSVFLTDNGNPMKIDQCDGRVQQRWSWDPMTNQIRLDGTEKCMRVVEEPLEPVVVWDCASLEPSQQWDYGGPALMALPLV